MLRVRTMTVPAAVLAIAALITFLATISCPTTAAEKTMLTTIEIPGSLRIEHAAIHSALVDATKMPGAVGEAARKVADVLHGHFVREEEIALPPLGLLAWLAAGERLTAAETSAALSMTDALRRELPHMLDEHTRIRAAVQGLKAAAQSQRANRYAQLADDLALHAQTEEEVLYPAAVLVGDIIRARASSSDVAAPRR